MAEYTRVNLSNCNNITCGSIDIYHNKLNIKFGLNGTGKSTVAKAIRYCHDPIKLNSLTTYSSYEKASVVMDSNFDNIMVFDENFVNQVAFQKNKLVPNAFNVFLKTPEYEERKAKVDTRLKNLHSVFEDDSIISLRDELQAISSQFTFGKNGNLNKRGVFSSLISKGNLYQIPDELKGFKHFLENKDTSCSWIEWKSKGEPFDTGDNCPFCSAHLDKTKHENQKQLFNNTYNKAVVKNINQLTALLEALEPYLIYEKYESIMKTIKEQVSETVLSNVFSSVVSDVRVV